MPTLVLSPRYTPDSRALRGAAGQLGWAVERLGGYRAPDHLRGRDAAIYGEPLFVEVVASQLGLALFDVPDTWLPGLPERHLRRVLTVSTLAHTRAGLTEPTFVKPADGRKAFEGKVFNSPTELPTVDSLPGDTPVYVCEPVTWDVEFRCHVLDATVATMSPYLRNGELAQTDDGRWTAATDDIEAARAYAEQLLADPDVAVPPAVVIDIGHIRGRGWAVIEANPAWGAGLYGCEPRRVLDVLARACPRREAVAASERRWLADEVRLVDSPQ